MYDRMVDVPRLLAGFALDGNVELPTALREAEQAVRAAVPAPFTHVGMNFYRDGNDSVAPHNDKLYSIAPGQPIALLSLGSARRMDIRAKAPPRNVVRLDLEPGSLLVMSHVSQLHYDHGVPKTKHAVGPRISLAFRVRPPGTW
jgi:alkylated DNA repair dioxygenase AlkB